MAAIVFTEQQYAEIMQKLSSLEVLLKQKQGNADELFVDNQEFLLLMNISKRTAQTWRDERVIAYTYVNHKFYYFMKDILQLLSKNRVEAKH